MRVTEVVQHGGHVVDGVAVHERQHVLMQKQYQPARVQRTRCQHRLRVILQRCTPQLLAHRDLHMRRSAACAAASGELDFTTTSPYRLQLLSHPWRRQ
jgi:hypothetical protein